MTIIDNWQKIHHLKPTDTLSVPPRCCSFVLPYCHSPISETQTLLYCCRPGPLGHSSSTSHFPARKFFLSGFKKIFFQRPENFYQAFRKFFPGFHKPFLGQPTISTAAFDNLDCSCRLSPLQLLTISTRAIKVVLSSYRFSSPGLLKF